MNWRLVAALGALVLALLGLACSVTYDALIYPFSNVGFPPLVPYRDGLIIFFIALVVVLCILNIFLLGTKHGEPSRRIE